MDPLTITGASIGLLSSIATLTRKASEVVGQVRDARKDMEAVRSELSALSLCVETLRDDASNPQIKYPPNVQASLVEVLRNCEATTNDILTLLNRVASGSLRRRIQWVTFTGDIEKLRSRLAAQKSTISIALDMTNILLVSAVAEEAAGIRADTSIIPQIKDDTSQLLAEISQLRAQLAKTKIENETPSFAMQRFLDETSTIFDDPDLVPDITKATPESSFPSQPFLESRSVTTTPTSSSGRRTDVTANPSALVPNNMPTRINPAPLSGVRANSNKARVIRSRAKQRELDEQFLDLFRNCFDRMLKVDEDKLPPLDKVQELLEQGADIDAIGRIDRGYFGTTEFTALAVAAAAKYDSELLSLLLTYKPDIDKVLKGRDTVTAVWWAIDGNSIDNMALLLDHGRHFA